MNDFKITISAIDRATATVRKINNSFSKLTRPINEVGKSTKALGRELGLGKMAKSIGSVAKNAKVAATEITKIGAPILALVGGGSIIGIAALATQWARLGSEVARTSQTLGVSSSELQSLRGAAEVAGVSSGELTGGLKSLGDTMQDALYGRNQQALAMLNRLGIGIHKTATGAIDSVRGFNDLANAIAGIKSPQVQGLVARQFGLETVLPLLRKGPAAIAAYQRKVRELGAEMSPEKVARAENFGIALNYLSVAGQGLRNTIGDSLIPAFQPLIEQLTNWISLNREAISKQVGEWAQKFADWIKTIDFKQLFADIKSIVQDIAGFVDAIGGWKVAAIGVALIMAGPLLLSITNIGLGLAGLAFKAIPLAVKGLGLLSTSLGVSTVGAGALLGKLGLLGAAAAAGWLVGGKINEMLDKNGINLGSGAYNLMHPEENQGGRAQTGTTKTAVDFFKSKGWSNEQAIGLAANLKKESGFNTDALGDGGSAYGVAQWHRDHQKNFMKWAGKPIRQSTFEEQLGFVNYELTQGTEKSAGDALRGASDERQAASIVSRQYERPSDANGEALSRANAATGMKHEIEINLKGLPHGTTATARKSDGSTVPVRVASGMPQMAGP
jgi:hypothetical protein